MTLDQQTHTGAKVGMTLMEIETGTIFTVLCSCSSSKPRSHTKRYVDANPGKYRKPTQEELAAWQSKT